MNAPTFLLLLATTTRRGLQNKLGAVLEMSRDYGSRQPADGNDQASRSYTRTTGRASLGNEAELNAYIQAPQNRAYNAEEEGLQMWANAQAYVADLDEPLGEFALLPCPRNT